MHVGGMALQQEYLVNLRQHYREYTYESTVVEWGRDEYDALVSAIKKALKDNAKEDELLSRLHLEKAEYDFSLCRLRPTGRTRSSQEKSTPYFDAEVRSYIKGLITRYMARFKVSDTVEELEYYKSEFDHYLKTYGGEFPDFVRTEMLRQYTIRKDFIASGIVKPLSVNLDPGYMEAHSAEESFRFYLEQTLRILRMFGFRISKKGEDIYKVYVPANYLSVRHVRNENAFVLNSAELIIYWSDIKDYVNCYDKERYGIRTSSDVVKFLGRNYNDKEIVKYCTALMESFITPFFFEELNDLGFDLYVTAREYIEAADIMRSMEADFMDPEDDYYDPDDDGGRFCRICGSWFDGDDIVCPDCSNNID